ncbi:hypothetical protein MAPG_03610 [Magnaporthiopsis poae ATCC 64411]|uniref:Uncharacterized protein n=1 Tax=Magnaporthiopsis poae (strain ATCC 64411 / 73-15) TaxID=644358 RepID=A0A0C4DUH1_MAGP6|nr:hypothetical protein MAPG_03610 [Magnaporthiopsis poae ATCC 64411]
MEWLSCSRKRGHSARSQPVGTRSGTDQLAMPGSAISIFAWLVEGSSQHHFGTDAWPAWTALPRQRPLAACSLASPSSSKSNLASLWPMDYFLRWVPSAALRQRALFTPLFPPLPAARGFIASFLMMQYRETEAGVDDPTTLPRTTRRLDSTQNLFWTGRLGNRHHRRPPSWQPRYCTYKYAPGMVAGLHCKGISAGVRTCSPVTPQLRRTARRRLTRPSALQVTKRRD